MQVANHDKTKLVSLNKALMGNIDMLYTFYVSHIHACTVDSTILSLSPKHVIIKNLE